MKPTKMKGIEILYDDTGKERMIQIDLNAVDKENQAIEDLIDIVMAEATKDEERYSLEEVKAILKKEGKL